MRNIYYFLALLLLLPLTGAAKWPEHIRPLDLSAYPMERVKPINASLWVSSEKPTDTLRIADNLYCVLNLSFKEKGIYSQDLYTLENAPEEDVYYDDFGKLSLFHDKELIFEQDSILFVGTIDYAPRYDKLIIPGITFQSKDNLDEITYYYLIDLKTKSSQNIVVENSMQACITDDGKSVIYAEMGHLYKYDIKEMTSEYVSTFGIETAVVFKMSYHNNTLVLYLYDNWVDEFGEPVRKYTIPDIIL